MPIYDVSGNEIATGINIADLIVSNLRNEAFLQELYSDSGNSMQGGCTDGTYIYYVFYNSNTINKYDIKNRVKTSVSYSSGLYGHANDMTYNPNTDRIYLTVMDDGAHIAVINPSTLEQESSFVLYGEGGVVQPQHGIAYDRIHNQYVFANATTITGTYGQRYTLTDANFNYIRTIVTPAPETYTIQGIETDGYFIYRVLWNQGGSPRNVIKVYGFDGSFIKTITVSNSNEMETAMNDWSGNWYCNFNKSGGGTLNICGINNYPFETVNALISESLA